ncbi:hypothetical protein [Kineococcus rhizosphaerae]|uniref:Uncharacterized protein n=1 Tax=Kineococcus rhizosphaerae TaxID=559628 RepID=A0A2T0R0E9_9ACTN|nr:hypothetical protein [Kineococcus rhizosphaerae]PRY12609.1 hypothetical protein CLV37_110169 [Kineococcus rhizosphaerae]
MSTLTARPALTLPTPTRWNRPLLGLAAATAVLSVVVAVLAVVDPHPVLGQDAWFKPLKFSLSIGIYALTMAWLVGLPGLRRPRLAAAAALVTVVGLAIEIAVILWAAATGTTSHFNVSTPLHATLWALMGTSIAVVWVTTLVIGLLVVRAPLPDRARTLAVRAGVLLGLVGMALAFLMTSPTAAQLADPRGVVGAHAVGVPDGGPGLPFLGWSTTGGDLRIGHFVGLHALQVIPLGLLALELLGRRVEALREEAVRFRLVAVGSLGYAGLVALLTVQALLGQPLLRPSAIVLAVAVGGVVVLSAVAAGALRRGR